MCEYRMPSAVEAGLNAKAYFQAYRGLCRMRVRFAEEQLSDYCALIANHQNQKIGELAEHKAKIWAHVLNYWKLKTTDSIRKEKEYFGEA